MGDPVPTRWVAGPSGPGRGPRGRLGRALTTLAVVVARVEVWGVALVGGLGLLLLGEVAPDVGAILPPAGIHHERGLAYVTPLPDLARFPYRVRGALLYTPKVGRLIFLEDGLPVGHDTLHDVIRERGSGAYSVWGEDLYLSASDGSDPRTNGRVYAVAGRAGLDPVLQSLALALLGLAVVGGAAAIRRPAAEPPRALAWGGRAAAALGALGLLACLGASAVAPARSGVLAPAGITRGPGFAYQATLPGPGGWPGRALLEDAVPGGTLREAGADLGPIEVDPGRVATEGAGRYWREGLRLVFSSSDGSDPRVGGRSYTWSVPLRVRGLAWLTSLAFLLAGVALGAPRLAASTLAWLGGRGRWAPRGGHAFLARWGPPGDRLCDGVVVALALWTVCTHVVVAAGGGLRHLVWLFALAAPLLAGGLAWWRPAAPGRRPGPTPGPARERSGEASGLRVPSGLWRAGVLAAALLVVGSFARWPDPVRLWWSAAALLGAGLIATLAADQPRLRPAAVTWAAERALWLLAVACLVLSLVAHRPDADDSFYVNLAVAAVDQPGRVLYPGDTLHGIAGLPLLLPVYRVHSYELLNGAVSYLTGIPVIYVFHWLSAAVGAFLVPLAHARLFRVLLPRHWLGAVATLTLVLVAAGDVNHWYGNLALVRIWQGKPLFLVVMLPLVQAYALRFATRPTRTGWLLLAASQVAAVGCTSTALWVAPAAALLALASAFRPTRRALATLALGGLASAYVLAAGWMARTTLGSVLDESIRRRVTVEGVRAGGPLLEALGATLGDYRLLLFGLGSMVAAWALAPPGLARRFAVVAPLGAWLGPLNVYAVPWVAGHLSGPTYWRGMWLVPVPILMTLVLTAPLTLGCRWRPSWRSVACLALVGAFTLGVPRVAGLGPANSVRLAWPTLKVSLGPYRWAALLNQSVPPGSMVAGPPEVANLVVTFHHHAFPLAVRGYLSAQRGHVDPEILEMRLRLQDRLARPEEVEGAPGGFREGLERLAVRAACLARVGRTGVARAVLREAGFRPLLADQDYELWVRAGPG